ncbi:MAG: lytic murein transglycosylase [Xylophilus ampelinus]
MPLPAPSSPPARPDRPRRASSSSAPALRRPLGLLALAAAAAVAGCATASSGPPAASRAPASEDAAPPAALAAGGAGAAAFAAAPATVPSPAPPPDASAAASAAESAARLASEEADFGRWVEAFQRRAAAQGIRPATLRDAFDRVRFQPRVIELDRSQPEFTRQVWDYLDGAVSAQRVAQGRAKLQQYRAETAQAESRYGVPAAVLVAIWGMESNYGGNFGNFSTIDALATLGFEGRRREWAASELLAALKIIGSGDIDRSRMIGSWAGAMGHTQFLPSSYLGYAVDADGDGRRDIWGSIPDVMASTANYLARSGWQPGQPWGAEVRLPAGFDYERADTALRQPTRQWAAAGVMPLDGQALPDFPDGSIIAPAGARGPAFLVGPNFRAILRYNNSNSYALGVSLLAQRIEGGPGVVGAWPRDLKSLSRTQVRALQAALNDRGFGTGTPDGVMGPATRDGVRRYQRSAGLPVDGFPTVELLQQLQAP